MSCRPPRSAILLLYKHLLRAGSRFRDYNFREYVVRSSRDKFRKYSQETSPEKITSLYANGLQELRAAQRQAVISEMYESGGFVVDQKLASTRPRPT